MLPLIGLGIATIGALGGAIGGAANTRKARKEATRSYNNAKSFLDSEYYRDPLTTVGNRSLLKSMDERMRDSADAIENRAAAGGATMENRLAARQSANETMSDMYSRLLQGEDARRQSLSQQKLGLDMQHSANLQNSYYQNAQNWQAWGSAIGNAGMQLGSAGLLANAEGVDWKKALFGK